MELLRAEKIERAYDKGNTPVLKGASISMAKGEFAALLGSSGSGKSTMLHCWAYLTRLTQGVCIFLEKKFQDFLMQNELSFV